MNTSHHLTRERLFLLVAAVVLIAAAGCSKSPTRPPRAPASGLWLQAAVPPPEAGVLAQLRALGVGEIFLEAAVIGDDAERPLERLPLPELPSATTVTLIVTGPWRGERTLEQVEAVARGLDQLRFEAEASGLVPIGIHFELSVVDDLAGYARFLQQVGKALGNTLVRTCSLPRTWLGHGDVERLVDAVDAVVAFLYGQRPGEPDAPGAWDFEALEQGLERLDAMGGYYFLGVSTLGVASRISSTGEVTDRSTHVSLRRLLWDRRFKLVPGYSLEGVNRLVYEVRAERPLTVGDWKLKARERVRIVQPASVHIERLNRLTETWNLSGLLGLVYYRVPTEDERLSLEPENLIGALDPSPATPEISLAARVRRGARGGVIVRVSARSHNAEMTELSVLDKNVIRVTAERGTFGKVSAGDFERYGLYERRPDGSLAPTFRRSKVLQLHLSLLDGGDVATSGDIEVIGSNPVLRLEASFILPDGRTLTIDPVMWRDGKLGGAAPER